MTKTIDALVEARLKRAFELGQTYWQQADSESPKQWKRSAETRETFFSLVAETTAALAQARAEQVEPVAEGNQAARLSDHASVPRELLAAACSAIDKKRDAPKTLAQLRRYTTGDLSGYTTTPAAPVAKPTAWRYTANGHVILMDGAEPPPDDAYDEGSLIGLAPTCKPSLQVPTDKDSLTVAPVAKLEPLSEDEIWNMRATAKADPQCEKEHWFVLLVRLVEAAHNAKLAE